MSRRRSFASVGSAHSARTLSLFPDLRMAPFPPECMIHSTNWILPRRAERTLENCSGGDVTFTETELQEINQLIEKSEVKGTRYPSAMVQDLWA